MKNLMKYKLEKGSLKSIKGGSAPVCDIDNGYVTCLFSDGRDPKFECLLLVDCQRQGGGY